MDGPAALSHGATIGESPYLSPMSTPTSIEAALQSLADRHFNGNGVYTEVRLADGSTAVFVRSCSGHPWRHRPARP